LKGAGSSMTRQLKTINPATEGAIYSYELTYITYCRMYRTVACLLCNLQAVVKPSDNCGMLLCANGEDALRQRPYFAGIALLQVE
jgi:hypothetical protein